MALFFQLFLSPVLNALHVTLLYIFLVPKALVFVVSGYQALNALDEIRNRKLKFQLAREHVFKFTITVCANAQREKPLYVMLSRLPVSP